MTSVRTRPAVGDLLRDWRQRRRLSQLDLASDAGVSARHLSFVETGRSRPSREMVLHLAEQLEVPLRERKRPAARGRLRPGLRQRGLDEPGDGGRARAVDLVLAGYEPYPAVVVDRSWQLVAGNAGVALLSRACRKRCSRRRSTCCG